jgi:hypothetical protein
VNKPKTIQFGDAPAQMAKTEHIKRETLNAMRRPITSAPKVILWVSYCNDNPLHAQKGGRWVELVGGEPTQPPKQRSNEHARVRSDSQSLCKTRLELERRLTGGDGLQEQDQRVSRIPKPVQEEQLEMHTRPADLVNCLVLPQPN